MGLKLNLKDKKLLYELDINSRQPCSQIAKKIGLSTEVVNYKLKKLEENNIITNYQTIINLSKLNILIFKICLSLQYLKVSKFQEIIEKLKKNNSIKWIVSCNGRWDLIITSETDSIENIATLKDEILSHFKNKINKKAMSIVVEAQNYNRDYLIDDKTLIKKSRMIMKGECRSR
ncbi:MAG: Lrp/AsnC family transcriptional regulator [archaeon]